MLEAKFGGQNSGQGGTIVFKADQGVNDPAVKAGDGGVARKGRRDRGRDPRREPVCARRRTPHLARTASSPARSRTPTSSSPKTSTSATLPGIKDKVLDAQPKIDGLQIELGGMIFASFEAPTTELIGLGFAIVILIVAFGSVLAMGLPVAVALFGIGIGGAGVIFFSHLLSVPEFAPFIGVMIGLGVGIDYALLIITRYREQLHANHTVRESVEIALDTAGRSVLFAGGTVVISLLGMLLMGISFVQGLAVSASVTVLITVLASLTLLARADRLRRRPTSRRRAGRGLIAAGFVAIGLVGVGLKFTPLFGRLPARRAHDPPRVLRAVAQA